MNDRRKAIEQAYIGTLRNVLILDDLYPNYGRLGQALQAQYDEQRHEQHEQHELASENIDAAVGLWRGFREAHMACDIASSRQDVEDSYIVRSDLLVLDYELVLGDEGSEARDVIRTLAASTRQNMVIIYTSNPNLLEVKVAISASLAGLPNCEEMSAEEEDEYSEWKREHRETDYSWLFSYIQRDGEWRAAGGKNVRFMEELLHERLRGYVEHGKNQVIGRLQISSSDPHWIRFGSVFVTLLNRSPKHTAGDLLSHLTNSLVSWDPSFMRLMLAYARAGVVEQGLSGDDRVLKDDETEAAWIFYTDESDDYEDRRERIGLLYARLVDDLLEGSLDRLLEFSQQHGGDLLEKKEERLKHAMQRLRLPVENAIGQRRVIHKINHYLAFDRTHSRSIRAGTVFKDQERNEYGVVTTPDCDLVPGRGRKNGDGKDLGKVVRIVYRPAFVVAEVKRQRDAYKTAAAFTHMFLHVPTEQVEEGYLVLGLYLEKGKPSDHPPTRVLYVANEGQIDAEGCFSAQRIVVDGSQSLTVDSAKKFQVLGQLRDRYALRLLHEAGHYLSRTGVDFVPWD